MVDIRALQQADLSQYGRLVRYAFGATPSQARRYAKWAGSNLQHTIGAFDKSQMLGGMWYYPYDMRVGEDVFPMGGVAAVATFPEARNRSVVAKLMTHAHQQMRREGRPLAVLMPFRSSFYERMGYAHTFEYHEWEFAPEELTRPSKSTTSLRSVDGVKEWKTLEQIRLTHGRRYTGTVQRNKAYWTYKWLTETDTELTTFLAERKNHAVAYMVTSKSEDPDGKHTLSISDAAWMDSESFRSLLELIWVHRDQVKAVRWRLPTDINLFPFLAEQYLGRVRRVPHMMTKLVDLKGAIEGRTYPRELDTEIQLDIDGDSTSRWNSGQWRITWSGGRARATKMRNPKGAIPACTIRTLAVMYMGYQSAEELQGMGLLQFPRATREILTEAFPASTPYMQERF